MLHLPLSHVWFSLLYHNSLLFFYFNRLLSIRPFLHTLPKKIQLLQRFFSPFSEFAFIASIKKCL